MLGKMSKSKGSTVLPPVPVPCAAGFANLIWHACFICPGGPAASGGCTVIHFPFWLVLSSKCY